MKKTKQVKRLSARLKDFDSNGLSTTSGKLRFHRPGSQNHKK